MIGSVAMMLEMSFNLTTEADAVWQAIHSVFEDGFSTADLSSGNSGVKILGTDAFGDLVMTKLESLLKKS